jgi:hypothetical protein
MVYRHEYDVDYVAEGKLGIKARIQSFRVPKLGNGVCNMLFISMLSDVARLRPQEDIEFSFEGSEDGERWRARVVADTFCAPRGRVTALLLGLKDGRQGPRSPMEKARHLKQSTRETFNYDLNDIQSQPRRDVIVYRRVSEQAFRQDLEASEKLYREREERKDLWDAILANDPTLLPRTDIQNHRKGLLQRLCILNGL